MGPGKKALSSSQFLPLLSSSLDTAALLFQEILGQDLGCLPPSSSQNSKNAWEKAAALNECVRGMIQSQMLVISIALWFGYGVQGSRSASGQHQNHKWKRSQKDLTPAGTHKAMNMQGTRQGEGMIFFKVNQFVLMIFLMFLYTAREEGKVGYQGRVQGNF